jgi:hypothetical protein
MNKKICIVCKKELPEKCSSKRLYCSKKCKDTVYKKQRLEWQKQEHILHPERAKIRQDRYRNSLKGQLRIKYTQAEYKKTARGIYAYLGTRHRNRIIISKEDFCQWYDAQEKICFYCGIPESLIPQYPKFFNGTVNYRFSIDRVDNRKGYELGNIVLSCRRCNSIKSDFFSGEEMKEIAQRYLTPKWRNKE